MWDYEEVRGQFGAFDPDVSFYGVTWVEMGSEKFCLVCNELHA